MNKKGILIVAVGNAGYGRLAVNLAISLKASGCTLPIQLVHTTSAISGLTEENLTLFTTLTLIDKSFYFVGGVYEYGFIKCSLDLLTIFEETIYIDADSLASPKKNFDNYNLPYDVCINQNGIYGQNRRNKDEFIDYAWLLKVDFDRFVNENTIIFNSFIYTQTSFIAFKTGEASRNFFEAARHSFYWIKELIKERLKNNAYSNKGSELITWMGNAVPDEVCMSLGIMISGIEPYMESFCGLAEWTRNNSRPTSFYTDNFYITSFPCDLKPLSLKERTLYNTLRALCAHIAKRSTYPWEEKAKFIITDTSN